VNVTVSQYMLMALRQIGQPWFCSWTSLALSYFIIYHYIGE